MAGLDRSECDINHRGLTRAQQWGVMALLAILGIIFRIHLFRSGRFAFDSDQAIAALGALRLLRGGEHLVYLPGQNFNGELFTYYFLPLHLIFPTGVTVLRLGMLPWSLALWLTTHLFCLRVFKSRVWALCASALMIFPPLMISDWTTHSASLYIVVLIGINLSGILLMAIVENLRESGWDRCNMLRGAALGFTLGFCFWCHFSMLVCMGAIALALALHPSALVRFAGFLPRASGQWVGNVISWIVQLGLLVALAAISYILLIGGGDLHIGSVEIGINHLLNPVIAACALAAARMALNRWPLRIPTLSGFGPTTVFFGMWLGALPVLLHNLNESNAIFFHQSQTVGSLAVAWAQFQSVLEIGIPIMMGQLHDYNYPVPGIPTWLLLVPTAIGYVALAAMIIHLVVAKVRSTGPSIGLAFVLGLFFIQIGVFSFSICGMHIINPRYIIPVHWAIVVASGGLLYLISRPHPRLIWASIGVCLVVVSINIAQCLSRPGWEPHSWEGIAPPDREVIEFLKERDIDRVSCGLYTDNGYWIANFLTIASGAEILAAPDLSAPSQFIRCLHCRDEVASAPVVAHIANPGDTTQAIRVYLEEQGAEFHNEVIGRYSVFCDVRPDILRDMNHADFQDQP